MILEFYACTNFISILSLYGVYTDAIYSHTELNIEFWLTALKMVVELSQHMFTIDLLVHHAWVLIGYIYVSYYTKFVDVFITMNTIHIPLFFYYLKKMAKRDHMKCFEHTFEWCYLILWVIACIYRCTYLTLLAYENMDTHLLKLAALTFIGLDCYWTPYHKIKSKLNSK